MAITMEELLASQNKKFKTLNRGEQIEGKIIAISSHEAILDLGAKSEGVLPKRELSDGAKVGDTLKVYVVMVENENGQTILSIYHQVKSTNTYKGHGVNWQKFSQALNQKSKFAGKVLEINKGGLIIDVSGSRGFLPNSQVGFELLSKASKGLEDLVGQTVTITVSEIDQNNNKLIFTQRGQVSSEIKLKLKEFKKDTKTKGQIVAVLPFGLVVSVGGVEGLVFISDVAWERVEDLSKLFKAGEEIEVKIIGADEDLGRLNLSIKGLSEDPFSKIAQNYPADEVVRGEVVAQNEAGIIFKFKDGVEGLLPTSKMELGMSYEAGKSMQLLVDSVDLQRRRINLAPFITSTEGLIYK